MIKSVDRGLLSDDDRSTRRVCQLYQRGVVPYESAWAWQRSLVDDRRQNSNLNDVMLLLEHPPTYTLGQGASSKFLKFDPLQNEWDLHRVERGGEVTYHCPGQLVGYPILNLIYYQKDLHWYLRQLEDVLIRALAIYGLQGDRLPGLTGVWVDHYKVAAIGIKVSRWITMHGFALNICPDMSGFDRIIPCGIPDKPVGSLEQFVPGIEFESVRSHVAIAFAEVFNVELAENKEHALPTDPSHALTSTAVAKMPATLGSPFEVLPAESNAHNGEQAST